MDSMPMENGIGSPGPRQVCGVDTYNFPTELIGQPQLQWIGVNYIETVVDKISAGLIRQEPGTQVLAMQCLQTPELLTKVNGKDDSIIEMTVKILIQVLVKNGHGGHWRLTGQAIFLKPFGDEERAPGSFTFEIQRAEEVQ